PSAAGSHPPERPTGAEERQSERQGRPGIGTAAGEGAGRSSGVRSPARRGPAARGPADRHRRRRPGHRRGRRRLARARAGLGGRRNSRAAGWAPADVTGRTPDRRDQPGADRGRGLSVAPHGSVGAHSGRHRPVRDRAGRGGRFNLGVELQRVHLPGGQRSDGVERQRAVGALRRPGKARHRLPDHRGGVSRRVEDLHLVEVAVVGIRNVVFAELQDPTHGFVTLDSLPGRGGQPGRHFFSTRQTINMLIKAQRAMVSDSDRDAVLADQAWELVRSGPFNATIRVETPPETDGQTPLEILTAAGIDDARKTRLLVLDPRRFTLLNGVDQETRAAVRAALGVGNERLPMAWASSAVFVCVNTQRRAQARNLAAEYEARRRVTTLDAVRTDDDLKTKATDETKEARDRLDKAIRAAYQHIIYLEEDSGGNRAEGTIRLDADNETALHGDLVWAALRAKDKTFGNGEFNAQALIYQLRDTDFGKPLSELRDAFWNTPRLPLLHSGEPELRAAIFGAVN